MRGIVPPCQGTSEGGGSGQRAHSHAQHTVLNGATATTAAAAAAVGKHAIQRLRQHIGEGCGSGGQGCGAVSRGSRGWRAQGRGQGHCSAQQPQHSGHCRDGGGGGGAGASASASASAATAACSALPCHNGASDAGSQRECTGASSLLLGLGGSAAAGGGQEQGRQHCTGHCQAHPPPAIHHAHAHTHRAAVGGRDAKQQRWLQLWGGLLRGLSEGHAREGRGAGEGTALQGQQQRQGGGVGECWRSSSSASCCCRGQQSQCGGGGGHASEGGEEAAGRARAQQPKRKGEGGGWGRGRGRGLVAGPLPAPPDLTAGCCCSPLRCTVQWGRGAEGR